MATIQSIDYNPSYPKRDKRILSLASRGLKLITGRIITDGQVFGSADLPITLAQLGLKKPPMYFEAYGGPQYAAFGVPTNKMTFRVQTVPYLAYFLSIWKEENPVPKAISAAFTGQAVGGNGSHVLGLITGVGEVPVYAKSVNGSLRAILVADLTAYAVDHVDLQAGAGFIRVFHDVAASDHAPLVAQEEIDGAVHFRDEGQGFEYLYLCDSLGYVYPMYSTDTDDVKLAVAAKELRAVNENTTYSLSSDINFSEFGKTPVGSVSGTVAIDGIQYVRVSSGNVDGWAFDFMAIGK